MATAGGENTSPPGEGSPPKLSGLTLEAFKARCALIETELKQRESRFNAPYALSGCPIGALHLKSGPGTHPCDRRPAVVDGRPLVCDSVAIGRYASILRDAQKDDLSKDQMVSIFPAALLCILLSQRPCHLSTPLPGLFCQQVPSRESGRLARA